MDTKQRIFLAARKRFDFGGVENLSMRRLADDVGLTPMALYRHFPDKDAIITALSLDALQEWEKRVKAIDAPTPLQWLDKEAEAFLDFALETPRRFEAAFLLPSTKIRKLPDVIEQGLSPPLNIIIAVIRQAQRRGDICDVPAIEVLMSFWGLTQGLISLYRADRFSGGEAAFRAVYRTAVRRCFRSFQRGDEN